MKRITKRVISFMLSLVMVAGLTGGMTTPKKVQAATTLAAELSGVTVNFYVNEQKIFMINYKRQMVN